MNESFRSLRWDWVGFGWFLSAGLTSLILLGLTALGLVGQEQPMEAVWISVALVVGFFAVGWFVGTRVVAAPVLHAVAMGLCTILAWAAANLFVEEAISAATWRALDMATLLGLLLLQIVAAGVGARMGVRWMREPPALSS